VKIKAIASKNDIRKTTAMESTNERGKENEVKIKVTVSENEIGKSIAMVSENQIQ